MLVTIPMKLLSLTNCRLHWRAMDRLKKQQKACVRVSMVGLSYPKLPVIVTMTRTGPRKLDDDNLAAAFKYVRDTIAAWYMEDDGSLLYTWKYQQRKSKEYSIEIEIEKRDDLERLIREN